MEVFKDYQNLFGTEKPLGIKEFYTVLKIAFPQPPAVEAAFTTSEAPLGTVLQHVKYSPTRRRVGMKAPKKKCIQHHANTELIFRPILSLERLYRRI